MGRTVASLLALLLLPGCQHSEREREAQLQQFRQVTNGMTRHAVLELLGTPAQDYARELCFTTCRVGHCDYMLCVRLSPDDVVTNTAVLQRYLARTWIPW